MNSFLDTYDRTLLCNNSHIRHRIKEQNNMWRLEIVILFGSVFCFVNSVEECNNELDLDCFCFDEPKGQ